MKPPNPFRVKSCFETMVAARRVSIEFAAAVQYRAARHEAWKLRRRRARSMPERLQMNDRPEY
jgi:hypothetical protein